MLRSIRTARHDGYDRVVLEFDEPLNGYRVAYVSQVREDPSNRPVALEGDASLEVVLRHATTDNAFSISSPDQRRRYTGPSTVTPRLPAVRQIKVSGDFEAVLSFGIGVDHRTGFDVHVLSAPGRLVIDVATA